MSEDDRVLGSGFEYNLHDREGRGRQTGVCVVKGERNTWRMKQVRGLASLVVLGFFSQGFFWH